MLQSPELVHLQYGQEWDPRRSRRLTRLAVVVVLGVVGELVFGGAVLGIDVGSFHPRSQKALLARSFRGSLHRRSRKAFRGESPLEEGLGEGGLLVVGHHDGCVVWPAPVAVLLPFCASVGMFEVVVVDPKSHCELKIRYRYRYR